MHDSFRGCFFTVYAPPHPDLSDHGPFWLGVLGLHLSVESGSIPHWSKWSRCMKHQSQTYSIPSGGGKLVPDALPMKYSMLSIVISSSYRARSTYYAVAAAARTFAGLMVTAFAYNLSGFNLYP